MKPLADKGEISQQQYDAYVAAARVADSQLSAAKQKLSSVSSAARMDSARAGTSYIGTGIPYWTSVAGSCSTCAGS